MNLADIVRAYLDDGYTNRNAVQKMCQDVVLSRIGSSSLSGNITVKGGVVLMAISGDKRRATQDMDIDFIRYSLDDDSILAFINNLSDKEVKIEAISEISNLNHQDYGGKRVWIQLSDDFGNNYSTKLDIGVHKDLDVLQDELCFDISFTKNGVSLLANSKEQIFVEKLRSLLKHGIASTRYKDVFDFYYLINKTALDKERFTNYLSRYVLLDRKMKINSFVEISRNLSLILNNKRFKHMLTLARNNWLEVEVDDVVSSILDFFKELSK